MKFHRILLFTLCSYFYLNAFAQVGINTTSPNASAQLDVTSTNKGFLPPRIALTSITDNSTISSPASGLLIYNTATAGSTSLSDPSNVSNWTGSHTYGIRVKTGIFVDNNDYCTILVTESNIP